MSRNPAPGPGIVAFAIMPPVFLLFTEEPVWWVYLVMCAMSWYCIGAWLWEKFGARLSAAGRRAAP